MNTLPTLTLEYAKRLADLLAARDGAPAYVVLDQGHPHLASSWCVPNVWPVSSIVYTAKP